MAKLTDRTALGAAPATNDLLFVTDVSDTTDAATGTDKKMTVANLFTEPTVATSLTTDYLTASEIVISDGSKKIVSAPVATYPSLAELAHVKGVTSAIQTQLNGKAPSLGADDNYVTDAEKVVIGNTSGTNSGNETTSTLGSTINAASAATPNDTDLVATVDTSVVKKITWTNVKAFLKTYFDTLYVTAAGFTLTGNIVLGENTSIDLDPAGSADGKYSGICITGTAGATLAFGDLCYLAVADSRWELADADAAATAGTPLLGMCVLAAAGDASATKMLLQGTIRADAKFPALTIGAPAYVGETAGAIQTAIPTGADNVIRVVGRALTADELYFCPSQDHQVVVA